MGTEILAVDIREAARRLSLSPRTVASLVARHHLPSRKVGRRRIIPVSALEEFILDRTVAVTCAQRTDMLDGKKGFALQLATDSQ
jgi:excisionase family DNA binding protein